jgi:hypothetical protein
MKSESGPPMTLGNAAATQVRQIVSCEACRHQVATDPAEQAQPTIRTVVAFGTRCFV